MLYTIQLGFLASSGYYGQVCKYAKLLVPSSIHLTSKKLGNIYYDDKKKYEIFYDLDESSNFIIRIKADGEEILKRSIHHDTITITMKDIVDRYDVVTETVPLIIN